MTQPAAGTVDRAPMIRWTLLALALAGCSTRKPAAARDDAAPPTAADATPAPLDADPDSYALGSFDQIQARFDAACGSKSQHDHHQRSCTRPLASGDAHLFTYVGLDAAADVHDAVVTLEVAYAWQTSGRPPECDQVIDDAVGYAKDLRGLTDQDAAQLASTMRAHPWKAGTWSKVRIGGNDFYFEYFDRNGEQPTCLAGFSQPSLIAASAENLIEEVQPAPR